MLNYRKNVLDKEQYIITIFWISVNVIRTCNTKPVFINIIAYLRPIMKNYVFHIWMNNSSTRIRKKYNMYLLI